MWDINKTKAWYIDTAGMEIQLEPVCYTKDAENNRILITRDGISKYKIPLIIPNIANKQTTSVDVLRRKQRIKRGSISYEIDELVFSTDRRIRNYSFYAKVEPTLLRQFYLWVKNIFTCFRNLLENIRKKNPELYDGITKLISVLWEVMVAILGFVSDLSPKKLPVSRAFLILLYWQSKLDPNEIVLIE